MTFAPDVALITRQVDTRLPDSGLIDIILVIGAGRPVAALTSLKQRTDDIKALVCARVAQEYELPVAASQL